MKMRNLLFLLTAVVMTACVGNQVAEGIMTVDLNKDYPEKEIILQDFMDVEYVPLESSDEFITRAAVKDVGEKYFVLENNGKLLLFDRHTGKGIRVIDHKGQGAEEYTNAYKVVLDEANDEIFVNDAGTHKICVYDLEGNFKRAFHHPEEHHFLDMTAFDEKTMICYDEQVYMDYATPPTEKHSYHYLISKQDGSIVQEIKVPYEQLSVPMLMIGDMVSVTFVRTTVPLHDDMLIIENSADSIYRFTRKAHKLEPFMTKIASTDPERLMTIGTVTPHYCFFEVIDKTFDQSTGRSFPNCSFVYDRQTHEIFKSVVLNADFTVPEKVNMVRLAMNGKIACIQTLEPHRLMEAYEKGELKGRLKDIASQLNEDSNPVIMVMTER